MIDRVKVPEVNRSIRNQEISSVGPTPKIFSITIPRSTIGKGFASFLYPFDSLSPFDNLPSPDCEIERSSDRKSRRHSDPLIVR